MSRILLIIIPVILLLILITLIIPIENNDNCFDRWSKHREAPGLPGIASNSSEAANNSLACSSLQRNTLTLRNLPF